MGIDYVQCLPADVEVRMNLWSMYVEVVIDDFSFTKSNEEFIQPGEYCSKHCQCEAMRGCVNGKCIDVPEELPSVSPTSMPTLDPSSNSGSPSVLPSSIPSTSMIPSHEPSPVAGCVDDSEYLYRGKKNKDCSWVSKKSKKFCRKKDKTKGGVVSDYCKETCGTCPKVPTGMPSTTPTECADDSEYLYRGRKKKGCSWVSKRSKKFCPKKDKKKGGTVSDYCKETCGEC